MQPLAQTPTVGLGQNWITGRSEKTHKLRLSLIGKGRVVCETMQNHEFTHYFPTVDGYSAKKKEKQDSSHVI